VYKLTKKQEIKLTLNRAGKKENKLERRNGMEMTEKDRK